MPCQKRGLGDKVLLYGPASSAARAVALHSLAAVAQPNTKCARPLHPPASAGAPLLPASFSLLPPNLKKARQRLPLLTAARSWRPDRVRPAVKGLLPCRLAQAFTAATCIVFYATKDAWPVGIKGCFGVGCAWEAGAAQTGGLGLQNCFCAVHERRTTPRDNINPPGSACGAPLPAWPTIGGPVSNLLRSRKPTPIIITILLAESTIISDIFLSSCRPLL